MYSSQNVQIPLSQSSCDIQSHLAEELSNRLTTSGSPATGQSTAYTVNYFSHCSDRIRSINPVFRNYIFNFISNAQTLRIVFLLKNPI